MPALIVAVLFFAVIGSVQFLSSLPGGERGLLKFEKACPIYTRHLSTQETSAASFTGP
jgi:hypothetical protein